MLCTDSQQNLFTPSFSYEKKAPDFAFLNWLTELIL